MFFVEQERLEYTAFMNNPDGIIFFRVNMSNRGVRRGLCVFVCVCVCMCVCGCEEVCVCV